MRNANNTVETINAAAAAIVSAEARVQPATVHKKRWGSCWNLHRCFGFHRNSKRIGHAVLVPEPVSTAGPAPSGSNQPPPPSVSVPFIAPPSSPASFLQSGPPSISQSPTKLLSLQSGPAGSMFTIGPYAYETQLVSPPVFSTEPSTAAFTPTLTTTPPSPDVPFAKYTLSQGEFRPYSSGASGTSTPFRSRPDHFPTRKYRVGSGTLTPRSRLGSGSLTPCQESNPIADGGSKRSDEEAVVEHRVSFELTGDDVARCLESKSSASFRTIEFPEDFVDERDTVGIDRKHHLAKAGSGKEFNFDSASNGELSSTTRPGNSWSFFPLLQPEVS